MGPSAKLSAEVSDREQDLFAPLPGLNEGINQNACQSEREEGLCLDNLKVGDLLELETKTSNLFYRESWRWSDPYLWSPQILSTTYTC